jgi:hypothetical protein
MDRLEELIDACGRLMQEIRNDAAAGRAGGEFAKALHRVEELSTPSSVTELVDRLAAAEKERDAAREELRLERTCCDQTQALADRHREALRHLLDWAERSQAGFPPSSEHWFAARDGARAALDGKRCGALAREEA